MIDTLYLELHADIFSVSLTVKGVRVTVDTDVMTMVDAATSVSEMTHILPGLTVSDGTATTQRTQQ